LCVIAAIVYLVGIMELASPFTPEFVLFSLNTSYFSLEGSKPAGIEFLYL